ncbi:conserved exported protein of unknown function with a putative SH3 type 3 domain [Bradyrhizobium sp. ORS 285]|uniref:hypothetical protein n=1 Tax=Bradyrhizobium sp. ORS 285 TaxID=115808 RepID=UPI0002407804|nr:hypothetical protein [Bradyrhizobium sp. ORS 285]CCD83782.1 conserved exported hypothetical protein [Bradyrhizobium sp. ORS 285]SMX59325.1 conserved exported protein of unknown function with a putative SH3 type 3 domain [Bradyrhizobium sp. ORS 285]
MLGRILLLLLLSTSGAVAAGREACNVAVDITDPDPNGANVRAEPGGTVLKALKNPTSNGWIVVHLTAQQGDWFEIDRAVLIDVDQDKETVIFQGRGFMHRAVVGVGGLQNGAVIYRDPVATSAKLDAHASGDQTVELLGCSGPFAKIRVKAGIGWTRQLCTNMVTTCS